MVWRLRHLREKKLRAILISLDVPDPSLQLLQTRSVLSDVYRETIKLVNSRFSPVCVRTPCRDVPWCIGERLKEAALVVEWISRRCIGESLKEAALIVEWISLGMFFLTVCCSVAIMIDVEGVPSVILKYHLEDRYNQIVHRTCSDRLSPWYKRCQVESTVQMF
ncbi:hypothetical protein T484DRAFT_1750860 [Baffinella frigidus]|nr:hypothetical protein T484DRAFT_1750860 [Cryptophyta sp. CCMP2293]